MKRAGFPTYKTFEGYEYSHIQFPPLFSREELESCQFIREHKNLILYGPVGTGKTHLAIAIGVKACQMGLKTKFFSVPELVLKLAEPRKQGTLEKLVKDLQKQDLLILDEWGLRPHGPGRLADAVLHCLRQLRAQEPHPDDEPRVLEMGQRLYR